MARCPSVASDVAFAPQLNEFNGNVSVQLKILDWRAVEEV
jgi:hypothetical protein